MADDTNAGWLTKKLFEENLRAFFTTWDIYIKFYTVFFTVNVAGIGLLVQHVAQEKRLLIVVTFIAQNALAGGTACVLTQYGRRTDARLRALAAALAKDAGTIHDAAALEMSPLPEHVGRYGAWANVLGHMFLSASWFATLFITK